MWLLLACADPTPKPAIPADYASAGPYTAGRHTYTLDDPDRPLTVEVWYPSEAEPGAAEAVTDLVVDPDDQATYAGLLSVAPADCPALQSLATPDLAPIEGAPLLGMSHCHGCTRFSMLSVAEHLARWGYVVVAPDHEGNTLFDELEGVGLPLDTDTLALRQRDLERALDAAKQGALGVSVDASAVGLIGHSFGAVTVGRVLQEGLGVAGGPRAAMFVGAPPENPLLPGVSMAELDAPLLFEVLAEDHSIGEVGNLLMDQNLAAAPGPAWRAELADAGHWSPSDLVGLTEGFMPGCGDDTRESTGEPFRYVDPTQGRATTAAIAAAFFDLALFAEADGSRWLQAQGVEGPLSATP